MSVQLGSLEHGFDGIDHGGERFTVVGVRAGQNDGERAFFGDATLTQRYRYG